MEYVLGLLVGLVGWLFFERSKRKTAEGVLENLETKKQILELSKESEKNKDTLDAEEEKRKEIKNDESKKSLDDLAHFFNDRK